MCTISVPIIIIIFHLYYFPKLSVQSQKVFFERNNLGIHVQYANKDEFRLQQYIHNIFGIPWISPGH